MCSLSEDLFSPIGHILFYSTQLTVIDSNRASAQIYITYFMYIDFCTALQMSYTNASLGNIQGQEARQDF